MLLVLVGALLLASWSVTEAALGAPGAPGAVVAPAEPERPLVAAPPSEAPGQGEPEEAAAGVDSQAAAGAAEQGDDAPLSLFDSSAASLGPQKLPMDVIPSGAIVAVIPIEGTIYDFTTDSLKRRIDRAREGGATVFVIELDTPGGVVTSAIDIARVLKSTPEPTIAWINDQAYSAGSLIASACDHIVVAPSSSFGDSAPVSMVGELAPTERAKALSPVLNEYRDNATANGYDYAPFHAMCVLGVEVYFIENPATGERRLVNQTDHAVLVRGLSTDEADAELAAMADLAGTGSAVGKPTREIADGSERGTWVAVTQLPSGASLLEGRVHDGSTLYTLSQTRAVDLGLAEAIVADDADLQRRLSAASVSTVGQTWSESLAMFLTNPFVRAALLAIFGIGLFVELLAPGFGLGGGIALLALVALVGAPLLVGLAEIWHVGLMVVGALLIVMELFAAPTFGIMGLVGVAAVVAGLVLSAVPSSGGGIVPLPAPGQGGRVASATLAMLLALVVTGFAAAGLVRMYGQIPGFGRFILSDEGGSGAGTEEAARGPSPAADRGPKLGETGTVRGGGLRPSGSVAFGDRWVDAVSAGGFVVEGTAVRVIEVAGNRVVVEPATD